MPVSALDALVPLMAEQLVDVLALLEKQEKEEERMDRLEDMMLEGKSVSAADLEAWRRWAKGRWDEEKKEEEEEKEAAEKRQLDVAARVPAVQVRDHGGASVPVHRQSVLAIPVVTQRRSAHSAKNRADLRRVFHRCSFLGKVVLSCVVQTTGVWSRQCRKQWSFCTCSSWTRCCLPVVVQDKGLVQTAQKTVEFLQVQLVDRVVVLPVVVQRQVPGPAGSFSALDDSLL